MTTTSWHCAIARRAGSPFCRISLFSLLTSLTRISSRSLMSAELRGSRGRERERESKCAPAQGAEEDESSLVRGRLVAGSGSGCILCRCQLRQATNPVLHSLDTRTEQRGGVASGWGHGNSTRLPKLLEPSQNLQGGRGECGEEGLEAHLPQILVLISPGVDWLALGVVHCSHAHLTLVREQVKGHSHVFNDSLNAAGPDRLGNGLRERSSEAKDLRQTQNLTLLLPGAFPFPRVRSKESGCPQGSRLRLLAAITSTVFSMTRPRLLWCALFGIEAHVGGLQME